MSESLLALPFEIDELIAGWSSLRPKMISAMPQSFRRDEWAYLLSFIEPCRLTLIVESSIGPRSGLCDLSRVNLCLRPRGLVALWLANNVTLLGPLMLVLLSLSGNRLRLKSGSSSENLLASFYDFALENLSRGALLDYLREMVCVEQFGRADERNRAMAARADVRIVFGSDEAVREIERYPHPLTSTAYHFIDRRSQLWLEPALVDRAAMRDLLKVFAIYGRGACTAPSRVMLIDASPSDADLLARELIGLWPELFKKLPPPHVASSVVMCEQWARALGWNASSVSGKAAVIASGEGDLECELENMFLPICSSTLEGAVTELPGNVQTVGYVASDFKRQSWLRALLSTSVKRFVPLREMHNFGPVWDGFSFWRGLFEDMEVGR